MKIVASLSALVFASAFLAGAANAEKKSTNPGPLSSCEQKVVDACEAQIPDSQPSARDWCEIEGFAKCDAGSSALSVRTKNMTAIGTVGGVYQPPKQTTKPAITAPLTNRVLR